MYSAKASGKRRFATYEPQMHTRIRRRHELAGALEHALDRDEIEVHFQPIVALASARPVLIVAIGRRVLLEARRSVAEWQARFADYEQLSVNVNLSPAELLNPELTHDVRTALAASGLAPVSLVLEITESGAMTDTVAALAAMNELRRLGVRLALDDFGTGHSSLSHLRDFPIDTLKIAKPFVDRLDQGEGDTTFTDAILRLAAALQLDVVAEGIERAGQAELLRRLACGVGQGFHFSRPLDRVDTEAYLAQTGSARRRIRAVS